MTTTTRNTIAVYATSSDRLHTGTHWVLFAYYPSRRDAFDAVERALDSGYLHAKLVETETFSPRKGAKGFSPEMVQAHNITNEKSHG